MPDVVTGSVRGNPRPFPFVTTLVAAVLAAGCGSATPPAAVADPVFTDPLAKIAETGDTIAFSETLFAEYVAQDPKLIDPTRTQNLYMTFYGGANQRGLALSFVDTVDYYAERVHAADKPRAIWIQGGVLLGVGWQYPTYRLTNEFEHWSDRAAAEDPNKDGQHLLDQVWIHGVLYTDPHPVTDAQVGTIWANYSAAYADMAKLFHGRAVVVHARAFIDPATLRPWSAFWAECRRLRQLVADSHVQDFLCAARDFPAYDSLDPSHWAECPPCP